ncbi:MAG: DUF99 family protein [Candidatus Micrarchaeota archaeon]|nr:DUF99 family protein [Candidatus Micrarchaeota archaeon]
MKSGIRYLAIASGPIKNRKDTILIGIVFRNGYIEGLLSTRITVDGTDATGKITKMVRKSRFRDQIRMILFNGIALAGLNVINPNAIEKALGVGIVILNRRRQNPKELTKALDGFSRITGIDTSKRADIVRDYSNVEPVRVNGLYIQSRLEKHHIRKFAESAFEALRVAHIIARGVSTGESRGRL